MQKINVTVNKQDDLHHFRAFTSSGLQVDMDSKSGIGSHGPTPIEMLLMAIGGCSGIDVVDFLHEENEVIKNFSIEVCGSRNRSQCPSLVEQIQILYKVQGEVPTSKLMRAIRLSLDKYCTVAKMLEGKSTIEFVVELNGKSLGNSERVEENSLSSEKN